MTINLIKAILILNAKKAVSKKGMGKTKGWTEEARAKAALTRKRKAKVNANLQSHKVKKKVEADYTPKKNQRTKDYVASLPETQRKEAELRLKQWDPSITSSAKNFHKYLKEFSPKQFPGYIIPKGSSSSTFEPKLSTRPVTKATKYSKAELNSASKVAGAKLFKTHQSGLLHGGVKGLKYSSLSDQIKAAKEGNGAGTVGTFAFVFNPKTKRGIDASDLDFTLTNFNKWKSGDGNVYVYSSEDEHVHVIQQSRK